ncbi:hypothetical protein PPRY_a1994 [Pseudoalteromonas prydzensis ACAM 620]|nr:hypothetical protein [Pseudoalteromonas prydzensis ACAM 620]
MTPVSTLSYKFSLIFLNDQIMTTINFSAVIVLLPISYFYKD